MHFILYFMAAAPVAAAAPDAAQPDRAIVVTASREPVALAETPASATLFDEREIEALALPFAADLVRLAPAVSVASTGPRGTQTQVRIRGAEANHSLLFVDGIRFNDPAAGNEPRFELLTATGIGRIEVVRGPQSALWGSEAIGGVIAAETLDARRGTGVELLGEYGGLDTLRAEAAFAARSGDLFLSGTGGWLRSEGIDSFGGGGERDGFDNRSGSLKAVFAPLPATEFGAVAHLIEANSEFDGTDPVSFLRADTLDETDNRIFAVRGWGRHEAGGWALSLDGSFLDSANRNRLGSDPLNSTFGQRFTLGAQVSRAFAGHRLTAAVEHEAEDFRARDAVFFGGTDQDRSRDLTALVGEWRADWTPWLTTGLAIRHDRFSAFEDATTLRASLLARPAQGWSLHAAYGEGIAQPSFYDLFGFFPGSFVGNPTLKPERSEGIEAGVRWTTSRVSLGATAFASRLADEIVDVFDPATFLSSTANASGRSRRRGVELEGAWAAGPLRVEANYTWLDAGQRTVAGAALLRETRRPRHGANLIATGRWGAFELGAALAYVGARRDVDFDLFPARTVTLGDYVLASVRAGYRVAPALELFARVENAFDADYQDVIGYATAGRTVHAGLRLALDR